MNQPALNILCIGQSQWNKMLTGSAHAPAHPDLVNVFVGEDQVASEVSGYVYGRNACNSYGLSAIADEFHSLFPGVVLNFLMMQRGNTGYSMWLNSKNPSGYYGKALCEAVRRFGKPDIIASMSGEYEAANGSTIPTAFASMRDLYASFLQDFRSNSDEIKWIGDTIGTPNIHNGASATDIANVRAMQEEALLSIPGMSMAGTLLGLPTSDDIHITDDASGAAVIGNSFGYAFAQVYARKNSAIALLDGITDIQNAIGTGSLIFSGLARKNYSKFKINVLCPVTTDDTLWIRLGDSSGQRSGSSDYQCSFDNITSTYGGIGTPDVKGYNAFNRMICNDNGGNSGIGSTGYVSGTVEVFNQPNTRTSIAFDIVFIGADGGTKHSRGSASYSGGTSGAMIADNIQFFFQNGNIASGTITQI